MSKGWYININHERGIWIKWFSKSSNSKIAFHNIADVDKGNVLL